MKIEIVGWMNKSNVGDEAFRNFHSLTFRNHHISFITPPQICSNPDMVVLGGGAVLSPYYLESMKHLDCPRYILGASIGYESEMDLIANYKWEEIYVRDKGDVKPLAEKTKTSVKWTPDIAFVNYPTNQNILSRYQKHPNRKPMGVLVTDYVNPAIDRSVTDFANSSMSFKQNLANELSDLSDDWEVFLIPCSTGGYGNDIRMNLDIFSFMKNEPTIIMDALCAQDMIDLIAQMKLTICQKFHAHIFSMIAGTPFVSIEYTRKVKCLLKEHSLEQTTCAKFEKGIFNCQNVKSIIKEVEKYSGTYKEKFLQISNEYYDILQENMKNIRKSWLKAS
jgi:polysaccharide pyruvyl transferase WcaK-like protein